MAATDIFPLEPDYAVAQSWSSGIIEGATLSGRRVARQGVLPPRKLFQLSFRQRPTKEKLQLEDWYRRFDRDFFNLEHKVWALTPGEEASYLPRYFAVEFAAPPGIQLVANEAYDIELELLEAVGRALFQYPDPAAGHPSAFLEESALSKRQGAWTDFAADIDHGGARAQNVNTNTTDFALWVYAGYGFRLWSRQDTSLGIFEVLLDDVNLGNVDLYAATQAGSQPVFTKLDVVLGVHRVKLRATNTKNPASTANTVLADALEYLL